MRILKSLSLTAQTVHQRAVKPLRSPLGFWVVAVISGCGSGGRGGVAREGNEYSHSLWMGLKGWTQKGVTAGSLKFYL